LCSSSHSISYMLTAACLCTYGSSRSLYLLCSSSSNNQQQRIRSILSRLNKLTLSYPLPCSTLPRVVMVEIIYNKHCLQYSIKTTIVHFDFMVTLKFGSKQDGLCRISVFVKLRPLEYFYFRKHSRRDVSALTASSPPPVYRYLMEAVMSGNKVCQIHTLSVWFSF